MKRKIYFLFLIGIVSFALNFIWEHMHAPLYTVFGQTVSDTKLLYSTFGDVLIVWSIYLLCALFFKDFWWIGKGNTKKKIFLCVCAGLLFAIFIELRAMQDGRWDYTSAMPLLFGLGLTPLLQMAILPFLTFKISSVFLKNKFF